MTIQEAKDQVAKTRGCDDWNHFLIKVCFHAGHSSASEFVADEVAKLYGDSQYNQALTDVYELLKAEGDNVKYHYAMQQLIKLKR